ncbi:SHOCT domain-containing protein [Homoserinimonas sp. OAct 916]|uniref:SHOCT domain-containing protein n=1 Tax=Homoserinimonas sp. OAct 916 TaxID=2211450 RepID=UPI000DBE158D|nr:SHOCT domain-containing protein [Homoserinimonas sp. OAct 916]
MMYGYGFNMWWMWLYGALAVAGLVVLIVVIVRIAAGGTKGNQGHGNAPTAPGVEAKRTPRQILDERYARGELTTEEYRERLAVLGQGS